MSGSAFAAHLPHFAVETPDGFDAASRIKPLGGGPAAGMRIAEAKAEERGRQAGRAEALAEMERTREQDRADFERRLAEREREIAENTANALADRLTAGFARIEASIGEPVGRVLARFLDGAVRDRAIDELSQTVTSLLSGNGAVRVKAVGPEALIGRLRGRLADYGEAVAYAVADGADITIAVDDTVVETQIAAWAARLAAIDGKPDD